MKIKLLRKLLLAFAVLTSCSHAQGEGSASPQAGTRSYAQNFKDMVLAECIATAYKSDRQASADAGSSVGALRDWTYYDWDEHPYNEVVPPLVEKYLARDYQNPLVEAQIQAIQFNFLKCLDLYHSKELEAVVKRVVINPKRSYRQDNPPSPKSTSK